jgi:hypothetical protein
LRRPASNAASAPGRVVVSGVLLAGGDLVKGQHESLDASGGVSCDLGFEEAALRTSATKEMAALYEKLGQPVYWRSRKTFETLAKPWKVREPGMQPLESWVGVKGGGAEESGREGFVMVGAILEK